MGRRPGTPLPLGRCRSSSVRAAPTARREATATCHQPRGCSRCGFGFAFELLEDYYASPKTALIVCDQDRRILVAGHAVRGHGLPGGRADRARGGRAARPRRVERRPGRHQPRVGRPRAERGLHLPSQRDRRRHAATADLLPGLRCRRRPAGGADAKLAWPAEKWRNAASAVRTSSCRSSAWGPGSSAAAGAAPTTPTLAGRVPRRHRRGRQLDRHRRHLRPGPRRAHRRPGRPRAPRRVVATKGGVAWESGPPLRIGAEASANTAAACDRSLAELGLDRIDLYQVLAGRRRGRRGDDRRARGAAPGREGARDRGLELRAGRPAGRPGRALDRSSRSADAAATSRRPSWRGAARTASA